MASEREPLERYWRLIGSPGEHPFHPESPDPIGLIWVRGGRHFAARPTSPRRQPPEEGWSFRVLGMIDQIKERLEEERAEIGEALHGLASLGGDQLRQPPQPLIVPITALADPGYNLTRHIYVNVYGEEGDFTATFFDANLSSGGETREEAVRNLRELILMAYQSLKDDRDEDLGPRMVHQRRVLSEFIEEA